jgi:hypothetical protein
MSTKFDYKLELNEDHLTTIQSALELYFRVGMGQMDYILQQPDYFHKTNPESKLLLDQLHIVLTGMAPNQFHSIRADKISNTNRTAYDIYQSIRHKDKPTDNNISLMRTDSKNHLVKISKS